MNVQIKFTNIFVKIRSTTIYIFKSKSRMTSNNALLTTNIVCILLFCWITTRTPRHFCSRILFDFRTYYLLNVTFFDVIRDLLLKIQIFDKNRFIKSIRTFLV